MRSTRVPLTVLSETALFVAVVDGVVGVVVDDDGGAVAAFVAKADAASDMSAAQLECLLVCSTRCQAMSCFVVGSDHMQLCWSTWPRPQPTGCEFACLPTRQNIQQLNTSTTSKSPTQLYYMVGLRMIYCDM
jgi:hypothetical protein